MCFENCIDKDYIYFSNTRQTSGMCCSQDDEEINGECFIDGRNTRNIEHAKTFLCPTARNCGPTTIFAKQNSQSYTIQTRTLDSIENLCNHAIIFDINAGVKDLLKVKFDQAPPGTLVHYAYGPNFEQAQGGGVIDDVEGREITIVFPNNLYFSIEHVVDPPGPFEFTFSYTNNVAEEETTLTFDIF